MRGNFEFPFAPLVRTLLGADIWLMQKCEDLAKKISDYYFTKKTDEDYLIDTFVKIALAIDSIRNKHIGLNKELDRVNFFVNLIGEHLAYKLSGYKHTEKKLNTLAAKYGDNQADFIGVKLRTLHQHIFNTNNLLDYYESIANNLVPAIESFQKEAVLKPATAQVFTELLELRKYGVKTSAFQEGILAKPGNFWIFSPNDYAYRELAPEFSKQWQVRKRLELMDKNCLAGITISTQRELLKVKDLYTNGVMTSFTVDTSAAFSLKFDGELSGFNTAGVCDLRSSFERRGQSDLYELLKANATFRLYDLIVPIIIHKKYELPSFPESRKFLGLFSTSGNFDPKLYLQRIRTIFDKRLEIRDELQVEINSAMLNSPAINRREHDVICHIRTLPKGYRASAKAIKLAKEILNYDLKEGETFVSQHFGKDIDRSKLHLAISKH
ncbi:MAG: hypothetical protein WCN88_00920 [Candidatus Falkowbacteria bacterium]